MKRLIVMLCLLTFMGCASAQTKKEGVAASAKPRINAAVSNDQIRSEISIGIAF